MSKVFQRVSSNRPGRSVFDKSYSVATSCDMGQIIPIYREEMVPGDTFQIGNQAVIRLQPLVAPVMHEITVRFHYFFVPFRILDENWEKFITGDFDGAFDDPLPRWTPTINTAGSLWDYLGFPVGVNPTGALPMDYIRRAYNLIWNEYYRDQNLQTEIAATNETILHCAWMKDYFTSSLPFQQRGTAPALPIGTTAPLQYVDDSTTWASNADTVATRFQVYQNSMGVEDANASTRQNKANQFFGDIATNLSADLAGAAGFNVAELRQLFQIQKWMELNARAGVRYTEFLTAHFGVSPRDDRLQRPEFIGGVKRPVVVSEVLQTSETSATTPQGNLAGHGLTAGRDYVCRFSAPEYGYVIGLMMITPKPAYSQGIQRQFLRRSRYDFYFPEFANLSEQAIERAEIFANGVEADNRTEFGFIGRYDEMRVSQSLYTGLMRNTLDYWHLGRKFSAAPELNEAFIKCDPDKRIFAVQDEDSFICQIGNIVRAVRPLPVASNPGLIDHV